jgi:uncharacterized protein (DUF1778 family)
VPRRTPDAKVRLSLRLKATDKAIIVRAAALAQTDTSSFIRCTMLQEARAVIDQHERLKLSRRDSQLVMELLENPPPANAKLRKAARAMPERS